MINIIIRIYKYINNKKNTKTNTKNHKSNF